MEKFEKTRHNELPTIRIYDDHIYSQKWLCKNDLFKEYSTPPWEWDKNLNIQINNENVKILFESAVETLIVFESEPLQKQIFEWLADNNLKSPEYWEKLVPPIRKKLQSVSITLIKEGLVELEQWVNEYNSNYVDDMMLSANLAYFGYDIDKFPEGDLWPNPLFDNLLKKYENDLNQDDLLILIKSLFNGNEEFMDCKATFTAINLLLKNQNQEIETIIIDLILKGLEGYEPGHRYYELSLLDRLIDKIFPTFSIESIIKLLQNAHPDNLMKDGDNFISLAYKALEKGPDGGQKQILEELIGKYS
jgi:hypothetical protein